MPIVCIFVPPSSVPSLYKHLDRKNLPYHEGHSLGDFTQFICEHGDHKPVPNLVGMTFDENGSTGELKPPTGFEAGIHEQQSDQMPSDHDSEVEFIEPPPKLPAFLQTRPNFEELKPLEKYHIGFDCAETINLDTAADLGDDQFLGDDEHEVKDVLGSGELRVKREPMDDYEAVDHLAMKYIDVKEHIVKAEAVTSALVDESMEEEMQQNMMQNRLSYFLVKDAVDDFDMADLHPETPISKKVKSDPKSAADSDDLKNILGKLGAKPKLIKSPMRAVAVTPKTVPRRSRKLPAKLQKTSPNKESPKTPQRAITHRPKKLPATVEKNPVYKESPVRTSSGRIVKRPSFADEVDLNEVKVEDQEEPAKKRARRNPPRSAASLDSIINAPWACPRCHHDFGRKSKLDRHRNGLRMCRLWTPTGVSVPTPVSSKRIPPVKAPRGVRMSTGGMTYSVALNKFLPSSSTRRSLPVALNIPSPPPISQKPRPMSKVAFKAKNLPRPVGRPKSVPTKRIGGVAAFACTECTHAYTYYYELKRHERIHKGK